MFQWFLKKQREINLLKNEIVNELKYHIDFVSRRELNNIFYLLEVLKLKLEEEYISNYNYYSESKYLIKDNDDYEIYEICGQCRNICNDGSCIYKYIYRKKKPKKEIKPRKPKKSIK